MRQLILIGLFFVKVIVPAIALERLENSDSTSSALYHKFLKIGLNPALPCLEAVQQKGWSLNGDRGYKKSNLTVKYYQSSIFPSINFKYGSIDIKLDLRKERNHCFKPGDVIIDIAAKETITKQALEKTLLQIKQRCGVTFDFACQSFMIIFNIDDHPEQYTTDVLWYLISLEIFMPNDVDVAAEMGFFQMPFLTFVREGFYQQFQHSLVNEGAATNVNEFYRQIENLPTPIKDEIIETMSSKVLDLKHNSLIPSLWNHLTPQAPLYLPFALCTVNYFIEINELKEALRVLKTKEVFDYENKKINMLLESLFWAYMNDFSASSLPPVNFFRQIKPIFKLEEEEIWEILKVNKSLYKETIRLSQENKKLKDETSKFIPI